MSDAEFVSFVKALDQCWLQGHPEDLASYLAEDVVFVAPGGSVRSTGIECAIESYRQFRAQATIQSFETSDYAVTERGGTAVVEYAWRMSWAAGGKDRAETGRDILVLSLKGDAWRVIWRTQISPAA